MRKKNNVIFARQRFTPTIGLYKPPTEPIAYSPQRLRQQHGPTLVIAEKEQRSFRSA